MNSHSNMNPGLSLEHHSSLFHLAALDWTMRDQGWMMLDRDGTVWIKSSHDLHCFWDYFASLEFSVPFMLQSNTKFFNFSLDRSYL